MKNVKRAAALALCGLLVLGSLFGCSASATDGLQIIRIGHNQSTNHPTHTGLLAFEEYVEGELGDKYDIQIFPSELLGSQNEMVQLTQTGAITFCVASNSLLETFSDNYTLFNLPYLFASPEAYHASMDDPAIVDPIFESTMQAGFEAVTWLDAGTRNFYTINTPIETPADLRGLKIRVQQSPTNVRMMELLGGSATPMGFGDVYTALQSQMLDGAENNELALTDNGHGDVCKYYSYTMHQMIPDILIGNLDFMESLSEEERAIFDEGFQILNQTQRDAWETAVEEAKNTAENEQGVSSSRPTTPSTRRIPSERRACFSMQATRKVLNRIMNVLAGVSLIAMTALTCWQVFTRYVLNNPSTWSEELVGYLFAWASLFGASLITGERGHMNIPVVVEKMPAAAQKFFAIFAELIAMAFSLIILVYGGYRITLLAMGQMTSSLGVAVGVFYVAMPVCGVINILYTILNIYDICKGKKKEA